MTPSLGNERPKQPVDETAHEYLVLGRPSVPLVERTARHARAAESFLMFNAQREEVDVIPLIVVATRHHVQNGVAVRQRHGRASLPSDASGFNDYGFGMTGFAEVYREGVDGIESASGG